MQIPLSLKPSASLSAAPDAFPVITPINTSIQIPRIPFYGDAHATKPPGLVRWEIALVNDELRAIDIGTYGF